MRELRHRHAEPTRQLCSKPTRRAGGIQLEAATQFTRTAVFPGSLAAFFPSGPQ